MATDLLPKTDGCERKQKEAEKFAINLNDKVVVRVEDEAAIAVLNSILGQLGGTSGVPFHRQSQTVTTPGVSQTLINETVAVGKSLNLKRVTISCRQRITYQILIDAIIVGSGRVGSGHYNSDFVFDVDQTATSGQVVKINILANDGKASDVEAYLQALES